MYDRIPLDVIRGKDECYNADVEIRRHVDAEGGKYAAALADENS